MALGDRKINGYKDNIKKLPDYPADDEISADELKAIFDSRGDNEIKAAINGIIEELLSNEAASQIKMSSGESVEEKLSEHSARMDDIRIAKEKSVNNEKDINELQNWKNGADKIVLKGTTGGLNGELRLRFDDLKVVMSGIIDSSSDEGTPETREDFEDAILFDSHNFPQADLVTATALSDYQKTKILANIGATAILETIRNSIDEHAANSGNPHGVTASQIKMSSGESVEEAVEKRAAEEPTDAKYFDIDYDGLVSLKNIYRGNGTMSTGERPPKGTYPFAESDNFENGGEGSSIGDLPEKLVIPEVIDGTVVTGFQDAAFAMNSRIKEIVFPITVTEIPNALFRSSTNLCSIKNTEQIKGVGKFAFERTKIKKALFPNLTQLGNQAFAYCSLLFTADIGSITTIPKSLFLMCANLSCVKSSGNITEVGDYAFECTYNLKNLSFLPQLTKIGNYAFFNSRVQFDWSTLPANALGTYSTPIADNSTDYWSVCTYEACENRLVSLFNQRDPEWVNEVYGTTTDKYETGCSVCCLAHIYSAIENVSLSSPKDFESVLASIDPSLLGKHPKTIANAKAILEALGYSVTHYDGGTQARLQEVYNALKEGAYVYHYSTTQGSEGEGGHAVVLYGVNGIGEALVADSDAGCHYVNLYDLCTYRIPIQNITSQNCDFLVVRKKVTE